MADEDVLAHSELRARTLRGLRWTVIARPTVEVFVLGSTVVLAHLISPAEFGHYAVAAIAGSIAGIPRGGVSAALVQRKTVTKQHLQAASALALLIGISLALLTLIAATVIVVPLYGARTAQLVRLTAPLSFVVAAGTVSSGVLQRSLAIRRLGVIEVISTLVRVSATIGMAFAGLDAVALVLGWLAGEVVEVGLLWASVLPPLPYIRRGPSRELLAFSVPASIASSSWFFFRNCDYAIIGARLGAYPTGLYFRAYTLGVEYQKKVSQLMGTVGFPMMARAQSASQMSDLRIRMVRLLTIVLFPLLALLAIEAPVLVPWLFGHRWAPAVLPTQILAVGGASTLVIDGAGAALMASGRRRAIMGFGWGHFAAYALAVFIVAPLGIVAVAIAASVVHTLFLLVAYVLMLSDSRDRPLAQLWYDINPAAICTIALVVIAAPASFGLKAAQVTGVPYLAAVSLLGGVVYLIALRTVFPASFQMARGFVAQLLPKNSLRSLSRRLAFGR
jgi:lipopolysaccharide exporter